MKALIPAAGLGTRFLPATKAQPKEMLLVVDRPAIQYVVEEGLASAADEVVIINSREKKAIEDHFAPAPDLVALLRERGKDGYADAVEAAIADHMERSTRADITRASLDDHGLIVVCPTMEQALEAVNVIAPEHLEMHVANAMEYLGAIRNAGAIFLGEWTPEAVGDYVAGPNHTLPTGGTARFSSPLSVDDFIKKSTFTYYTKDALAKEAGKIARFAEREGLHAHARSALIRAEKEEQQCS